MGSQNTSSRLSKACARSKCSHSWGVDFHFDTTIDAVKSRRARKQKHECRLSRNRTSAEFIGSASPEKSLLSVTNALDLIAGYKSGEFDDGASARDRRGGREHRDRRGHRRRPPRVPQTYISCIDEDPSRCPHLHSNMSTPRSEGVQIPCGTFSPPSIRRRQIEVEALKTHAVLCRQRGRLDRPAGEGSEFFVRG